MNATVDRSSVKSVNPWTAYSAEIVAIQPDYTGVATFGLRLTDDDARRRYACEPGQFNMLYVPGVGEAAISVSGHDARQDIWWHTIRSAGNVTRALFRFGVGGQIALRGPFGTAWPLEKTVDQDVLVAVGGIGLAPLRMALRWLISRLDKLGQIWLLYGARSPSTRLYVDEIAQWTEQGIGVFSTVDRFEPGWQGHIGVVPALIDRIPLRPDRTLVLTCGPEVMMRYTALACIARGVPPGNIWLSMERNMQCAVGFCGHCQYGPAFVCKDGPVLCYDRVASLLDTEDL